MASVDHQSQAWDSSWLCLRMAVSLPRSWRRATTLRLMSPTCPIITWFPLRRTFWTESALGPIPQPLPAGSAAVHPASCPGGALLGSHPRSAPVRPGVPSGAQGPGLRNDPPIRQPGVPSQEATQLLLLGAFSAHSPHQPVSASLGLAPHPWGARKCLQDVQCQAGARTSLGASCRCPCFLGGSFLSVQGPQPPGLPHVPLLPHRTSAQNISCEILMSCQVLDATGRQKQRIQKSEYSEVVAGPSMHLHPAGGKS
ncbi:PX domain-containing protein 1 isoform X1 [Manis pentadactyla]|uniref:PX domain-containing protein 1 isoform X1 n=1 Tax=Manis pentadactyla TaxID=143292 RepID=UPI00255CFB1F|nr:PX domain-containing protein 1 isoform X1 [Manis pentadactyla]